MGTNLLDMRDVAISRSGEIAGIIGRWVLIWMVVPRWEFLKKGTGLALGKVDREHGEEQSPLSDNGVSLDDLIDRTTAYAFQDVRLPEPVEIKVRGRNVEAGSSGAFVALLSPSPTTSKRWRGAPAVRALSGSPGRRGSPRRRQDLLHRRDVDRRRRLQHKSTAVSAFFAIAALVGSAVFVYWQAWVDPDTDVPWWPVVLLGGIGIVLLYLAIAAWTDWWPYAAEPPPMWRTDADHEVIGGEPFSIGTSDARMWDDEIALWVGVTNDGPTAEFSAQVLSVEPIERGGRRKGVDR